jgi:hypothetical protein
LNQNLSAIGHGGIENARTAARLGAEKVSRSSHAESGWQLAAASFVTVTKLSIHDGEGRCRWCRRPLVDAPGRVGRPRVFCRRSCRQRDFEARRLAAAAGIGDYVLTMTRDQLARVRDDLYVLECAVGDVRRDLAAGMVSAAELGEALRWLLDAAEPVIADHSRL